MSLVDFSRNSIWLNALIFMGAAAVVWLAGTRLARYADTIADRTGVGKAFLGLMLLGGVTSLPEAAATTTASAAGDAPLAVNNLLGGVALQVSILAMADALIGRDALSSILASPVVMLQGTLKILMLVIVACGVAVGEPAGWPIGGWSAALVLMYVVALWLVKSYQHETTWIPDGDDPRLMEHVRRGEGVTEAARKAAAQRADAAGREHHGMGGRRPEETPMELRALLIRTAIAGVVILGAGYVATRAADVLADQTGIGSNVMGAVFLALATSLPEISTVLEATRLREYEMAFSDIFGTNLVDVALIFLADAVYAGGPVLNEVGPFSLVAALLGIAVTTIFLAGFIERKDRVVLRMGVDSLLVLAVYAGGVVLLWTLRA